MRTALGVDIGGTKVAVGLVGDDGRLLDCRQTPTPAAQGASAVFEAVAAELSVLLASSDAHPRGVGVSTGGIVDAGSGQVVAATDLIARWAGADVARWLIERMGLPVKVDNDGNAFALAEHRFGAARGVADVLCVSVGTGIGGGVILEGRLRHGPRHLAGELGHVPAPTVECCSCGKVGHVEAASSGPAIVRAYLRGGGEVSVSSASGVAERADAGDELATAVISAAGTMLGRGLAGPALALDVSMVVVGGGVAAMGERFVSPARQALWSAVPYGYRPEVVPASLGPTSAVIGAASLILDQ